MKNPTFKDFIFKVGGLAIIFVISVVLTTSFFPGYESFTIIVIASFVFIYASIKSWKQKLKK